MKDLIIGLDIGTMGIRSIVYDTELKEISKSHMPYPLINLSDKEIEQDAHLWWALAKRTIAESTQKAAGRIRAIGVSSQSIAFVPVDVDAMPLRNAISWLDIRAERQTQEIIRACTEEDIYKETGKRTASYYTLPKILWLKENEPDIFEKAHKLLFPHDYVIARLCGHFVTDHSIAAGSMMYDIHTQQWSKKLLSSFDIRPEMLPSLSWSAKVAGSILPDIAEELGIPADVVVCVGGQDQKCAAFGAGITDGIATVSLGTAAAIEKKWNSLHLDKKMRIPCFSYLFEGTWVTDGVISTAAASLRWLKETFFEDYTYEQMSRIVEQSSDYRTKLSFFPHLTGCASPNWYKEATGSFTGIALNTTRADFVRALFEGIAMQIKNNLDAMDGTSEIRVFGGGAASDAWCGIIADVTGCVVRIPQTEETACEGAAMLAGMACGIFENERDACKNITTTRIYEPDTRRTVYYAEKHFAYQQAEKKLWGPIITD
jgi:xylulokinase